MLEVDSTRAPRRGGHPITAPASRSSTTTTTSWWSTSRSAWPPIRGRLERADGARSSGRRRLPDLHLRRAGAPGHRPAARRRHLGADGGGQERARLHGLKRAFRSRTVDKTYHTLVQGHPDPFWAPSTRPSGGTQRGVQDGHHATGRQSVTHYDTLHAFIGTTLLEVHLETGRTHQIRVHMAAIHHPCVGDPMYGSDPVLAARARAGASVAARGAARFRAPGPRRAGDLQLRLPRGSPAGPGRRRSRLTPGSGRPRATGRETVRQGQTSLGSPRA